MRWVTLMRDRCDAPPEIRSFLVVLATYADPDGVCWPSLQRLASNLGITPKAAKQRRNRAVQLGWLEIERPGKWRGMSTRYRLQTKGVVDAPLPVSERGKSRGEKGGSGGSPKGVVDDPRTTKKFHERAASAPFLETALAARTCAGCGRDFFGEGYGDVCSRRCEQSLGAVA